MSKPKITSLVAPLFFAAMLLGGCVGDVEETGLDEETADTDESADTDENVGEAESAMMRRSDGCGWFCPDWAKDLSDCLMIPCDD